MCCGSVITSNPPCLQEHSHRAVPICNPCGPGKCMRWAATVPLPARAQPAPSPSQGSGNGSRESQNTETKVASIPIWEARCPHTSAFFVPVVSAGAHSPSRQSSPNKARGQALFVPCAPGVMGLASQYLLPPKVLYSGLKGPPLLPTILSCPPGTQPGDLWARACKEPSLAFSLPVPVLSGPGLECSGTRA